VFGNRESWIFGVVEVVWKVEHERFFVHIHILLPELNNIQKKRLKRLFPNWRERYRSQEIVERDGWANAKALMKAVHHQKIGYAPGLLGYMLKGKTAPDRKYVDSLGSVVTDPMPHRSPRPIHNEVMRFYDRHTETQLLFRLGLAISKKGKIYKSSAREGSAPSVRSPTTPVAATRSSGPLQVYQRKTEAADVVKWAAGVRSLNQPDIGGVRRILKSQRQAKNATTKTTSVALRLELNTRERAQV
jgi:hypothetical protein